MRLTILSILLAFLFVLTLGAAPQKAIVVSFEDPNTPQSEVDKAMQAIKDAGGMITHEYKLFKGFAAKASESAIEAIQALGSKYVPTIEQDITFSTQDQ
ncbi:hypothetical protein LTS08_000461 [Lithohypha guttulata]|nr:hypothetical protein LTS08_000461 [Lithohypha guttulata]